MAGEARSSQDGRKSDRDFSFCVTTRRQVRGLRRGSHRGSTVWRHPPPAVALVVAARQRRTVAVPPAGYAAAVGVWRFASGATAGDTQDLGSTAGGDAVGGRGDHNPSANKFAKGVGKFWPPARVRGYADLVPREVSPAGAAREARQKSLGHFYCDRPLRIHGLRTSESTAAVPLLRDAPTAVADFLRRAPQL